MRLDRYEIDEVDEETKKRMRQAYQKESQRSDGGVTDSFTCKYDQQIDEQIELIDKIIADDEGYKSQDDSPPRGLAQPQDVGGSRPSSLSHLYHNNNNTLHVTDLQPVREIKNVYDNFSKTPTLHPSRYTVT